MILSRDLLTALGLDLTFSDNIILRSERTYEGCSAPIVNSRNYKFKSLTNKIVKT